VTDGSELEQAPYPAISAVSARECETLTLMQGGKPNTLCEYILATSLTSVGRKILKKVARTK